MLLGKFIPRILKDFLRGRIEKFISQSNRLRHLEEKLEKLTYDVQTILMDNFMGGYDVYETYISDHRPVMLSFSVTN